MSVLRAATVSHISRVSRLVVLIIDCGIDMTLAAQEIYAVSEIRQPTSIVLSYRCRKQVTRFPLMFQNPRARTSNNKIYDFQCIVITQN